MLLQLAASTRRRRLNLGDALDHLGLDFSSMEL